MPDSENVNSFYEDSDDSVCDKDYVPPISSPSSDDSIEITKSTNVFPSFSSICSHKQAQNMLKEQQNCQNDSENIEFLQDTTVVNTNNQQSESETNVEYDVHEEQHNKDRTSINRVNRELTQSDKKKQQTEVNIECYEENQQSTNLETGDQILPES